MMTEDTAQTPWFRLLRPGRAAPVAAAPAQAKDQPVPLAQTTLPEQADAAPALDGLVSQAAEAANFLKALGHDGRLTILCHLVSGPKSVTELENLLSTRQAVVSQQLARLRLEGLVSARREGQAIFYSILDPKVIEMLALLGFLFRTPAARQR
jgi:DNA-binding transcriptional ArsR family regulator